MGKVVGAALGPLLALVVGLLDLPLSVEAHRLAAIATAVIVYWITEPIPIPVTALLASVLCVLFGVAPGREVFAPYADPVIYLFLGAFLVAEAAKSTGLDAQMARSVLSLPGVGKSPFGVIAAIGLLTMFLSMWMSNTATAALMTPLVLSATRGQGGRRSWAVLGVAYAASLGGVATPIGTPPNLIAVGFLDREVGTHLDFVAWARFGLPLAIGLTALLLVGVLLRGGRRTEAEAELTLPERQPWDQAQVMVAAVFVLMIIGWLLPTLVGLSSPALGKTMHARMPESVVAVLGAIALFALPARNRPYQPVLEWRQSANIDWGTILLFGGGLSLGHLVSKTGLGDWIGRSVVEAFGVHSQFGLIALSCGVAILLTETMSNTAAINVIVPVVLAMAADMAVDPVAPVVAAALGASMAFALPISTPPNAIAYGTGEVTIPQMLRRGLVLDVVAFVSITVWVGFVA